MSMYLNAADVGGSMLIHTFGTYFGLGCSIWLYYRRAIKHPRNDSVYYSDIFAMIGKEFVSITIYLLFRKTLYFFGCSGPVSIEH